MDNQGQVADRGQHPCTTATDNIGTLEMEAHSYFLFLPLHLEAVT